MAVRLTDLQIGSLLQEPKHLPVNFLDALTKYKDKGSHKEAELNVVGDNHSSFVVYVRQSRINPFDFSVILGYRLPTKKNIIFRLRRYNGKHPSPHKNKIENQKFVNVCHIHTATERYQRRGNKEEDFAEPTERYATVEGAIKCLLLDCNFISPNGRWIWD